MKGLEGGRRVDGLMQKKRGEKGVYRKMGRKG